MSEHFTEAEARALVGKRFRSNVEWAGVPVGTVGGVTGVYAASRKLGLYGVDITWEGIPGGSPLDDERGGLTDGFSRGDLEAVLEDGRRAMELLEGA